MARLENKIALVTGAAKGIGFEIARKFAEEGAEVYLNDIDGEGAHETSAKLNEAGLNTHGQKLDVTSKAEIGDILAGINDTHGRLDLLVNNAGLNVRDDFRHLTDDGWEKIRSTNLDSVVHLSRTAFPFLKASGNASVLNISSIMANRHLRQLAAYSATKGAVSSLSRAMAVEWANFGIRVNFLAPGYIDTALTTRFIKNPAVAKVLLDKTPLKRFGSGEDVANAALFLCSDEAAFITGTGLTVDGGMSVSL